MGPRRLGGGENGDEATGDAGKQRLTFSGFASTMMAGPEPLMELAFRYLELLQAAHTWSLEDGQLMLEDAGGATTLRFAPDTNR
jgi:heat shock protein HslJ